MLRATILALTAAGLHAGWNLIAKRSADRFLALWGQFFAAGVLSAAVLVTIGDDLPATAWLWATICGLAHIPYVVGLAKAYDQGDFSVVYPIARGVGALLAALGGVVLLGDHLSGWSVVAIIVVAGGVCLLATGPGPARHAGAVGWALLVAVSIGVYTTNDSHAARSIAGLQYPLAVFVAAGAILTLYGALIGRSSDMTSAVRADWRKFVVTGVMSGITYVLVLLAVRTAPVGYVAALRESSVLIAAVAGSRLLGEDSARRRSIAAAVILAGLALLVAAG